MRNPFPSGTLLRISRAGPFTVWPNADRIGIWSELTCKAVDASAFVIALGWTHFLSGTEFEYVLTPCGPGFITPLGLLKAPKMRKKKAVDGTPV